MHLKRQKRIGDNAGDVRYVFTQKKLNVFLFCEMFYPPYNARI
jgi:hypothetical protein